MSSNVLTLNASYEPLEMASVRRVVLMLMKDRCEIVESDPSKTLTFGKGSMPWPTVIRLKKMIKIPDRMKNRVINTLMFARDNYTCQYCGKTDKQLGSRNALTRDHVMPKSRGGKDTWTNCVTACSKCNSRKDNKTPSEAGLKLRRKPQVPNMIQLKWQIRKLTPMQEKYVRMFFGDDWMLYVDK